MTTATIHAGANQSQYIRHIYHEHYARLRHYFLIQLDDASRANACVQETMRHFFFFMEDRDWEAEAEYIFVYLMRIAGLICSRALAEKKRKCEDTSDKSESYGSFSALRPLVLQAVKERLEFMQFALRPMAGDSR
jgi:hypothetical protein